MVETGPGEPQSESRDPEELLGLDARGRLWVVEGHTYPVPAPEGQGRDRILIFEDTDGDGTLDKR
ncbi:MAG: hypothetical protein V4692_03185, partial [Bdellovibrionota bacterium]